MEYQKHYTLTPFTIVWDQFTLTTAAASGMKTCNETAVTWAGEIGMQLFGIAPYVIPPYPTQLQ